MSWDTFSISLLLPPLHAKHHKSLCTSSVTKCHVNSDSPLSQLTVTQFKTIVFVTQIRKALGPKCVAGLRPGTDEGGGVVRG